MEFKKLFTKITGNEPYPWQTRLYDLFLEGKFPSHLDIPTGMGKTTVITLWLLAFLKSKNTETKIPTRLVYIVDRRAIVDQASNETEKLKKRMKEMKIDINLNISKMRGGGGGADNREWLKNPEEPAIIIGTIDMIGSRLLFSGYGLGRKIRPFYAGMLGQDSLIILDETHLSPAMERVLKEIKVIGEKTRNSLRPSKILLMSATQINKSKQNTLKLDSTDLKNENIKKRYESNKKLNIVKTDDIVKEIIKQALNMNGNVLIYVQKPKDVLEIAQKIKKTNKDTVVLTGTMRGFERDRLVKNNVYKRFDSSSEKCKGTCFLVSTSAGEVGVDLDADNMVCDLSTFDSIIQRLGRVNRNGEKDSKIIVVYSDDVIKKNKNLGEQLENTKSLLQDKVKGGSYNANPHSLEGILEKQEIQEKTFAPRPETQVLTSEILDMWSMTSIYEEYTSRPFVSHWLRGKAEFEIPETYVVWREDVKYLTKLKEDQIQEILDDYRILNHEIARDSSENIFNILKDKKNLEIIIIKPNGGYKKCKMDKLEKDDIKFATLILPNEIGGLSKEGLLENENNVVSDVADDIEYTKRARLIIKTEGKEEYIQEIISADKMDKKYNLQEWLNDNPKMHLAYDAEIKDNFEDKEDDDSKITIQYYIEKPEQQTVKYLEQELQDHLNDVEKTAKKIVEKLQLPSDISDAIITAARFHDMGKKRKHWQECMKITGNKVLAKTGRKIRPLPMGGFRHELASVIDVKTEDILKDNPEQDLILHLIAAHHGWARPCFKPNALEVSDKDMELEYVIRRFAKLQKRFGVWGLAWLEGLVRGADWKASDNSDSKEEKNEK